VTDEQAEKKTEELRRLAAEAEIVAETTVDPNRKRALRIVALKYKRLAGFVGNRSVIPVNRPKKSVRFRTE